MAEVAEFVDKLAKFDLVGAANAVNFEGGDVGTETSEFQPGLAGGEQMFKKASSGALETEFDEVETLKGVEKKMDGGMMRKVDAKTGQAGGPGDTFQISALIRDTSGSKGGCLEEVDNTVAVGEVATCFDFADAVSEDGSPADFLRNGKGEFVSAGFEDCETHRG